MFRNLLPREESFFEFFAQAAAKIVEATAALNEMLADLGRAEFHARRIKELEHEADTITHRTLDALHKTFVTPLDRNDIHRLITRMDDILDLAEEASERLYLYEIQSSTREARELGQVLALSAEKVQKAVAALATFKKPEDVTTYCVEVNRLENEADTILRNAVARLFHEEQDVRLLIKWKEIYESLETATDRCEDVANIIEGIVVESA